MGESEATAVRVPTRGRASIMTHIHAACRRALQRESEDRESEPARKRRARGFLPAFAARRGRGRRTKGKSVTRAISGDKRRVRSTVRFIGPRILDPRRPNVIRRPGGRPLIMPRMRGGFGGFNIRPRNPLRPGPRTRKKREARTRGVWQVSPPVMF